LTLGPEMARLSARLADEGLDARAFETRDDLAADLTGDLCPGDRILFKGAHAFALERVAQALAPETHLAKEPDSC